CAHGIGAATKPEEIDSIALLIVVHQERVGFGNVLFETGTESQAGDEGPTTLDFKRAPRLRHRADAGVVEGQLIVSAPGDFVGADDVGEVGGELIVSTITTQNEVSRGHGGNEGERG